MIDNLVNVAHTCPGGASSSSMLVMPIIPSMDNALDDAWLSQRIHKKWCLS